MLWIPRVLHRGDPRAHFVGDNTNKGQSRFYVPSGSLIEDPEDRYAEGFVLTYLIKLPYTTFKHCATSESLSGDPEGTEKSCQSLLHRQQNSYYC